MHLSSAVLLTAITSLVVYTLVRYFAEEMAKEQVEEAERTARLLIEINEDFIKEVRRMEKHQASNVESINYFKNRLCPITREEIPIGADIYYLESAKGYVTKEVFDAYK